MGTIVFNKELFCELPRLLHVSQQTISTSMGLTRGTWQHTQKTGDCLLRNLTKLCNIYKIDVKKFFIEEGANPIPNDLVTSEEEWDDLVLHAEKLRTLWHGGKNKAMRRKDVMDVIGCLGNNTMLRLANGNSPIRASQWATLVNTLDLDFYYIWERKGEQNSEELLRRIDELERQLEELKKRIK